MRAISATYIALRKRRADSTDYLPIPAAESISCRRVSIFIGPIYRLLLPMPRFSNPPTSDDEIRKGEFLACTFCEVVLQSLSVLPIYVIVRVEWY